MNIQVFDVKRFQAIILLISFIIGILQPVMPLAQNIVEGNFIEIIQPNQKVEFYCTHDMNELPDDWKSESRDELISLDFYPVPIQITKYLPQVILAYQHQMYQSTPFDIIELYHNRLKRPPR